MLFLLGSGVADLDGAVVGEPAVVDLVHIGSFSEPTLVGLCRFHHQIKGRPRWRLDQPAPGTFTWTTPTGRTYTVQPDSYAA